MIISFHPNFISRRAMQFAEMIKDCEETGLPKVGVSDDQTHLRHVCHPHTHTHTHTLHTPTAYILHTHTLRTPYLYTVQVVCVTRQLCSVSRPSSKGQTAPAQLGESRLLTLVLRHGVNGWCCPPHFVCSPQVWKSVVKFRNPSVSDRLFVCCVWLLVPLLFER